MRTFGLARGMFARISPLPGTMHRHSMSGNLMRYPSRSSEMTARNSPFFEVPLVIFLGPVEFRCGNNLSYYRAIETAARLQRLARCLSCRLLFRRVIKDYGSVLRADVGTLAIGRGRIVHIPKCFQKLVVADLPGVEFNQH